MITKFKDLDFNNETLQKAINSMNRVTFEKASSPSPKYLVIDWSDVEVNDELIEKLKNVDIDLLQEYIVDLEYINNTDVLLEMFKLVDEQYEDEGNLYGYLVPQYVGHDLYVKLTYEENFNLLMKVTDFETF